MAEAMTGGIGLSGASLLIDDLDGTYSVVLPCSEDPTMYVAVNNVVHITRSLIFKKDYVITAVTSTTVIIDVGTDKYLTDTFTPKINRLYVGDDVGYGLEQWKDEDAYNYMFKPQTRDQASPNNLTGLVLAEGAGIIGPTIYPVNLT